MTPLTILEKEDMAEERQKSPLEEAVAPEFAQNPTDALIWQHRLNRMSLRQIAEAVGIGHETVRRRLYWMLSQSVSVEDVDLIRKEESLHLDELSAELLDITLATKEVPDGQGGVRVERKHDVKDRIAAVRAAVQVSGRRSALFGLDAPKQLVVEIDDRREVEVVDAELVELAQQMRALPQPQEQ